MNEGPKRLLPPGYRIREVLPKGEKKLIEASCEPLAGGFPEAGPERAAFLIFPGGRTVKAGSAGGDDALRIVTIKGIPRSSLFPGAVLLPADWPVAEGREALFLRAGKAVPKDPLKVAGGPDPRFNAEGFAGPVRCKVQGSFLSASFSDPYPLLPGADYVFSMPEGEGTGLSLTLLRAGKPDASELRRLEGAAPRRPDPHPCPREVYGRILHARGFARIPPVLAGSSWNGASVSGGWVILDSRKDVLERKVLKLASRPGGAGPEILRIPGVPDGLVVSLAASMAGRGGLKKRGDWYFPPGDPPLSPFHRGWLEKVEEAGFDGIRMRSAAKPADREALDALVRSGLAVGGGDVWLSRRAYGEISAGILAGDTPGSRISMADARSRVACSRAVTIEVLALMERDGLLSRSEDGEERVVP